MNDPIETFRITATIMLIVAVAVLIFSMKPPKDD